MRVPISVNYSREMNRPQQYAALPADPQYERQQQGTALLQQNPPVPFQPIPQQPQMTLVQKEFCSNRAGRIITMLILIISLALLGFLLFLLLTGRLVDAGAQMLAWIGVGTFALFAILNVVLLLLSPKRANVACTTAGQMTIVT